VRRLAAILEGCKRDDVYLKSWDGKELEVRGDLTPELREALKRHKPNILAYLKTSLCHHDLKPEECKVCNGYVRRPIESQSESQEGGTT
jgi:hypothetical protein